MRLRLSLGAALLTAMAALNAGPAFAQADQPKGNICVENIGGFAIETTFTIVGRAANRIVETGLYPILQTRCAEFAADDHRVDIKVHPLAGVDKSCTVFFRGQAGKTLTARMHGTTLVNHLECPM